MAWWRLEKSCYCWYLKTGCIIVAVLSLIVPIIMIISLSIVLAAETKLKDKIRALLYIMIGMTCAVVIPINILLLIGTIKAIDWPLIMWLVVHALVLGFQVYNIFATFHIGMVFFISAIISFVIYIYMWFVVYSHLIELSELSEADSPQNVQPDDINPEE